MGTSKLLCKLPCYFCKLPKFRVSFYVICVSFHLSVHALTRNFSFFPRTQPGIVVREQWIYKHLTSNNVMPGLAADFTGRAMKFYNNQVGIQGPIQAAPPMTTSSTPAMPSAEVSIRQSMACIKAVAEHLQANLGELFPTGIQKTKLDTYTIEHVRNLE